MDLKVLDGEVFYIRADGSVSPRQVNGRDTLFFLGYPFPGGSEPAVEKMWLIYGDPVKGGTVYAKARGHGIHGHYLLSKRTGEAVFCNQEEEALARRIVSMDILAGNSVAETLEKLRQEKRAAVDVEELALKRGAKVWKSHSFDGYWSPEVGQFPTLPDGWAFLPRGDTGVTREVRKSPFWVLMEKQGKYSKEIGSLAPEDSIKRAKKKHGRL